ncbi:MAG: hypothetical protein QT00_C0001G0450 [archaeon GW2011_AR5]|nr:MAG: hypothetical protein QT00_C0001G0450 [archaeon GW2011_AR5]
MQHIGTVQAALFQIVVEQSPTSAERKTESRIIGPLKEPGKKALMVKVILPFPGWN